MKIGLLSDTHSFLDPTLFEHFKDCDEIWHAGDIGAIEVTDALQEFKPLRAVYGNIDNHTIRQAFPEHLRFECAGIDVWITHIGGYPPRYTPKIKALLEKNPPHLFISGHSHILKVMFDQKNRTLHMNPGACGRHGWHKMRTALRFDILEGKIQNVEAIELGLRGAIPKP